MPPAKKANTPAAAAVTSQPGDEAMARYQAALIEGKTEDEARLIGWPDGQTGGALPPGHCGNPERHERHDVLFGEYGSTDYRTCEGNPLGPIEFADADNAMITPTGDRFFPDSLDDALVFAVEHGAQPAHPERFPFEWVEQQETPLPPPFEAVHCPTPTVCFPYGFGPDTSHAACIHGETHA